MSRGGRTREDKHSWMRYENQFSRTANLSDTRQRAFPVAEEGGYWVEEQSYNRRRAGKGGPRVLTSNWFEEQVLDEDLARQKELTGRTIQSELNSHMEFGNLEEAKAASFSHPRPKHMATVCRDPTGHPTSIFLGESQKSTGSTIRFEGSSPCLIGSGSAVAVSEEETQDRFRSVHQKEFRDFSASGRPGQSRRAALREKRLLQLAAEDELRQAEEKKRREQEEIRAARARLRKREAPTLTEEPHSMYGEQPVSFYTTSAAKASETGQTTVYHTRESGGNQFARCTKFSKPIAEKVTEEW